MGMTYEITVQDAGVTHTVSFADTGAGIIASADDDLHALVVALTEGSPA